MFSFSITEENGFKWINLSGRIDSLSSKDLEKPLEELTISGERKIIANFEGVKYISSAGLRVFLKYQKQLKKAGGEIFLYKMSSSIFNIFKISGFDRGFTFAEDKKDLPIPEEILEKFSKIISKEINGILLKIKEYDSGGGNMFSIGSSDNFKESSYEEENVVSLKPEDIKFGTGLASLGEGYKDYKFHFGEALIINNNLFIYPAVKRTTVDFMEYSGERGDIEYHFLHGFGFNGSYRRNISFDCPERFIKLSDLADAFLKVSDTNLAGIVFIAESKGIFGMNLKKIPLKENKPPGSKDIFHIEHFPEWMNYPLEGEDINQVVLAAGLAAKDKSKLKPEIEKLLPKESNFHFHGCIFSQELFNREIEKFEEETNRIIKELKPLSIKHLLGKSRIKYGIAGIIELEG